MGSAGPRGSASRPPVLPLNVSRLLAQLSPHFPIAGRAQGVLFGPLPQGVVPFRDRLADQVLHDPVPLPPAHQVPGGRHGRLAATYVGWDALVGDKVQFAAMQRDAELLWFMCGHGEVSAGEGRLTRSPHRTEAGAVGYSVARR